MSDEIETCDGKPVQIGDEFAYFADHGWHDSRVLKASVIRLTKTQAVIQIDFGQHHTEEKIGLSRFNVIGHKFKHVERWTDEHTKRQLLEKEENRIRILDKKLKDAITTHGRWSLVHKLGEDLVKQIMEKLQPQEPTGEIASSL